MSAGACGAFIHGLEDEFMGTSMQFVSLLGILGFLGSEFTICQYTHTHTDNVNIHARVYILNLSITIPNT